MHIDINQDYVNDPKQWLLDNSDSLVFGIKCDTEYDDIVGICDDNVLVVYRETESLDRVSVVCDQSEFSQQNLGDKNNGTWGYVKKSTVMNNSIAYKKVVYGGNISNGFIKKEVLYNLIREYEIQSKNKFNSDHIVYDNTNLMLEAFWKECNMFAEIDTNTSVAIIKSKAIATDALLYLVILGIREY